MDEINVRVKRLDPRAKLPVYATSGAAAADLFAVLDAPLTLDPGESSIVHTGVALELLNPNRAIFLYNRSGLATKHGLMRVNPVGVIDSDYRGEIVMPLINNGDEPYTIQPGERIAQMCITPIFRAFFVEVDELSETERGTDGFGSTGRQ